MATDEAVPGYTYGDPGVASSPVGPTELDQLKATVMFGSEDEAALRRAGDVLADQVKDVVNAWYDFVASQPHLVAYYSTPDGEPIQAYLDRTRLRFEQWILDTCRRPWDQTWLDYQHEIGLRHTTAKKNVTDGVNAPAPIGLRHLIGLIYPVTATMRPFLEAGESDPEQVEKMAQAWTKAVTLQVALWTRPYVDEQAW